MNKIAIYTDEERKRKIEERAKEYGLSASSFINFLISKELNQTKGY